MARQLYRSSKDQVIAGVCGGLGEYFDIDPVIFRALWVIGALFYGTSIFIYLILVIVIPKRQSDFEDYNDNVHNGYQDNFSYNLNNNIEKNVSELKNNKRTIGVILIVAGCAFLLKEIFKFNLKIIAPVCIVALGIYLIYKSQEGD